MTKSPTPTESTKKRKARRAQKGTKLVDYTAIANRHKKVGVTTAVKQVWLIGLRDQPSQYHQKPWNQKDQTTSFEK